MYEKKTNNNTKAMTLLKLDLKKNVEALAEI